MSEREMAGGCDREETGTDPVAADVLRRCARRELSPAVALVRLLIAYRDLDSLRRALAKLHQADDTARLRGAIQRLYCLLKGKTEASALVLHMLEQEFTLTQPHGQADEVGRCRRVFDRLVEMNAEASVALYSLGEPGLLDAATREVIDLLVELAVLGPERHVLDIGCGIGRFERGLANRVAAITGIDISSGMLESARQRCAGLANVEFIETSGRDLAPLDDGSFDVVLAVDAMPYVHRAGPPLVKAHFEEAARVLRAGGDFVILNLSYRGDVELDRQDLRRLAAAAGFCVLRNGTMDLRLWDGVTYHLRKPEPERAGVAISWPD